MITHDRLHVRWGKKDMYVDLGAEQILAAEKGSRKIAVEVKSFLGLSEVADLEQAIGQYTVYHEVLFRVEPTVRCFWLLTRRRTSTCSRSRLANCWWTVAVFS